MTKRKRGTFYIVPDWVVGALKLKGTARELFCIIFSKTLHGNWSELSIQKIIAQTGMSKSAIFENLKKLINKKFILKQEKKKGCVSYCQYKCNLELLRELEIPLDLEPITTVDIEMQTYIPTLNGIEKTNYSLQDIIKAGRNQNIIPIPHSNFLIYFLFYRNEIVYIGKTRNGAERIFQHIAEKIFDSYTYYEVREEDLDYIENTLIIYFNPKYNKTVRNNCGFWDYKSIQKYLKSKVNKQINHSKLRKIISSNHIKKHEYKGQNLIYASDINTIVNKYLSEGE